MEVCHRHNASVEAEQPTSRIHASLRSPLGEASSEPASCLRPGTPIRGRHINESKSMEKTSLAFGALAALATLSSVSAEAATHHTSATAGISHDARTASLSQAKAVSADVRALLKGSTPSPFYVLKGGIEKDPEMAQA